MMTTRRIEILLIGVATLAMAAGVAGGLIAGRWSHSRGDFPQSGRGPEALADHLSLSSDQRDKIRKIWEDTRETIHTNVRDAESLNTQREEAWTALLTEEQKSKRAEINKSFDDRAAALQKQRELTFAAAVEQTKTLLTDAQRTKYDEILAMRRPGGPRGDGRPGDRGPRPHGDGKGGAPGPQIGGPGMGPPPGSDLGLAPPRDRPHPSTQPDR